MYILYNNVKYHCKCSISGVQISYSGLPTDFKVPVSGSVELRADDDFTLRVDKVEDYLRQTFVDGTLTLTNQPEPAPIPDIEPDDGPTNGAVTWDELAAAYNEGVNSIDE